MKDSDRIEQLKADAATLQETHPEIAHRLTKAVTHIVNRDKGPNRETQAENLRLRTELDLANKTARDIDMDFLAHREKTKPMRHINARMTDELSGLKKMFAELQNRFDALAIENGNLKDQIAARDDLLLGKNAQIATLTDKLTELTAANDALTAAREPGGNG